MKILILGGTSFLGPHQIKYALERGHKVSTFTRGKTIPKINPEVFSKVKQLVGDREDNLDALKNRKWDVVIDNSGRKT
ncbi:MAG: NAD-dependent epimerase/dehydratase family protein, partial [Bacteroidota bacterium]